MRMVFKEKKEEQKPNGAEKLLEGIAGAIIKLSVQSNASSGMFADLIQTMASSIVTAARKITEKMEANEKAINDLSSTIKNLPPHPHTEKLHLRVTEWTKTGRIETIEVTRIG